MKWLFVFISLSFIVAFAAENPGEMRNRRFARDVLSENFKSSAGRFANKEEVSKSELLKIRLERENELLHPGWPYQIYSSRPDQVQEQDTIHVEWKKIYSSGLAPGDEDIGGIAVDNSGNIYVTCASTNAFSPPDIMTIKYDNNGSQVWAKRYNGPDDQMDYAGGIKVDSDGNVYVVGYSFSFATSIDFILLKYDSSGNLLWQRRYGKSSGSIDGGFMIEIDMNNNVLIAGVSYYEPANQDMVVVKYNSSGERQWQTHFAGNEYTYVDPGAMTIDDEGNTYVIGTMENYFDGLRQLVTFKVADNGIIDWSAKYECEHEYGGRPRDIAVDSDQNVYIAGYVYSDTSHDDYLTIKYNNEGLEEWIRTYSGSENYSYDEAISVVVDGNGNIFVCGESEEQGTRNDITTIKYKSDGTELWTKHYSGQGSDTYERPYDMVIDDENNIYITGEADIDYSTYTIVNIKYNSQGTELWTGFYTGSGEDTYPNAMVLDKDKNVFTVGRIYMNDYQGEVLTAKFNSSGVYQWASTYDSPGNSEDEPACIARDLSGNIYIGGNSEGPEGDRDFLTIKYDNSGNIVWTARYAGTGGDDDEILDLAVNIREMCM